MHLENTLYPVLGSVSWTTQNCQTSRAFATNFPATLQGNYTVIQRLPALNQELVGILPITKL